MQIEREAVAQIHRRRGEPPRPQEPSQCEPRLGTQVALPRPPPARRQSQSRAAGLAGHVDRIARTRPIPPQRLAARHRARNHDVAHGLPRMGQVAAQQRTALARGKRQQAAVKGVHPPRVRPGRQRQRHEAESRYPAHGSDIAQSARQRLPAGILRAMGVAPEMHILDQHIGGEEQVLGGPRRTENGAVVADAEHCAGAWRQGHPASNAFDEIQFGAGHHSID